METYRCLPALPQREGGNIKNIMVPSLLENNIMVAMQYLGHFH